MFVFVINLDRSPDRLQSMQAEARRAGVTFERVPAIDGRGALPSGLKPQFPKGSDLSSGEVGCYASHLTVHQRILAADMPCALVLEDDVRLTPRLMEVAQAAAAAAPEGWDLIHLSAGAGRAAYAIADLPGSCHLIRHMRPPRNTAGYLISRSGAAKILMPAPRTRTVDMDIKLAHERTLDVLGVYPPPVIRGHHLSSTIGSVDRRKTTSAPDALRGHLYAARKLGLSAYVRCRLARLRRGAVQIVRSHKLATP